MNTPPLTIDDDIPCCLNPGRICILLGGPISTEISTLSYFEVNICGSAVLQLNRKVGPTTPQKIKIKNRYR